MKKKKNKSEKSTNNKKSKTVIHILTIKDNIKNVILNQEKLKLINTMVIKINKIVIHSYQFLKLYLCDLYSKNIPFPEINKNYICHLFQTISFKSTKNGGRPPTKENQATLDTLKKFYDLHYKSTTYETIEYDNLTASLAYEAIDMLTNIENNIKEHFINHLNKYINIVFKFKEQKDQITKDNKDKEIRKKLHQDLYREFYKIKKDIIQFDNFESDPKYHKWIKEQQILLFPYKKSFDHDNIFYELKSNSQSFLRSMFYINHRFEIINKNKLENEKQIRLFNALPLRTNIVPKHICIDTVSLIMNLIGSNFTHYLKTFKKFDQYHELWSKVFNLNIKSFNKNNYNFNNMIKTDGVSCSILFEKSEMVKYELTTDKSNITSVYIENCDESKRNKLQNMKMVCADPNYSDLIYCGSKDEEGNLETFRYTQNQRRLETRSKKYMKLKDKLTKETYIDDKTIKEIETELSLLNSKTCNFDDFKIYCKKKNEINKLLFNHYKQNIFRKLKLNTYTNTQKSEAKLVNNYKKKFGHPDKTVFIIGDYDKGNHHMKGVEPVICKKFRDIFKKAGYQTFLVNEFRTSMICNGCDEKLEKFHKHKSKKPKNEGQEISCHGLLRCQSVKHECEIIHNRDKNAVQNMLRIVDSILKTGKRPNIFTRENSCTDHACTNHILTDINYINI